MIIRKTVFALLTGFAVVGAQTSISGNVGDMVLDSSGNPFIVEKDITVPKGKSLTIKEGCALLFKPFTGLIIQGNCSANGTKEHPVIFTSINDSIYNKTSTQPANAFDWNGITVSKGPGKVAFNFIDVRFSVYGIKSQNSDIIIIQSTFRQNGQFHFTVNEKIQTVQDNQPFSYNEIRQTQTKSQVKTERSRNFKILRYSLLGVGAASSIGGIIMSINAGSAYSDWKHIEQETNPLPPPGEYEKRRDKFHSAFTGALILDILGGLSLGGFGVTFLF
ncbi:MAG: hypothetical protein ABSF80_13485 [Chitinispirillaceae bacterium]